MTTRIPLKANFTGSDVTSLGEFVSTDSIAVAHGGTGGVTAAEARTNLGVDAAGTVNYTHPANHAISVITGLQTALDAKTTESFVTTAITNLVDSSPATLNTLNELAAALGDDANYATTTATAIGTKMPLAGGAFTGAVTTNSTFDGRDVAADGVTADAALPKAGGTMSGALVMADQIVQRPVLKDYAETKVAMAGTDVDLSLGNVHTKTISGGQTLTFSNPPASGSAGSFTLILTNGGSATVTWPSSVDWPLATAPALTAAGVDLLVFTTIDGGTTWMGIASGIGMA